MDEIRWVCQDCAAKIERVLPKAVHPLWGQCNICRKTKLVAPVDAYVRK